MDQRRYDEEEIDLLELLWAVLSHWRGIIVCAIATALVVGAYSGFSWYQRKGELEGELAAKAAAEEEEIEFEEHTAAEKNQAYADALEAVEASALYYQDGIKGQRSYLEGSLMMQLNWREVTTTYTDYVLRLDSYPDDKANLALLGHAIETHVLEDDFMVAQAKRLHTEPGYLRELIGVSRIWQDDPANQMAESYERGRDNYYAFYVSVMGKDAAFTEDLSAAITEHLRHFVDERLGAYVPFATDLSFVFQVAEPVTQISVANVVRDTQMGARANYNTEVGRLAGVMSSHGNVKALEDLGADEPEPKTDEKKDEEEEEDTTEEEYQKLGSVRQTVLKSSVLGLLGGVFLGGLVFAAVYVLGTRLKATPSAQGRFGVCVLGILPHADEDARHTTPLDRWLADKAKGLNAGLASDEVLDMVAINVGTLIQQDASVLVTSSIAGERVDACARGLIERLEAQGLGATLTYHAAFLRNAEANRAISTSSTVILVEEAGESRNDAVAATVEKIALLGTDILGMVIA